MNYEKHYNLLIERAKSRLLEGYSEKHHIIPRCMGGSDDPDNLVRLTPEEHYVAHQLLIKIYPDVHGLVYAAHMMTVSSKDTRDRNNKKYGWLKRKHSELMSKEMKGKFVGKNNPMYGRNHSEETKKKCGEPNKGRTISKEHKIAISDANKGKVLSSDTRKKIGDAHRGKEVSKETRQKLRKANLGKKMSKEFCEHRSEIMKGENNPMHGVDRSGEKNSMFGKKHSEETKKKISEKCSGKNASQYGTIWITNDKETKKIKKDQPIPNGWRRGRK
jgi:hypothetical protein